MGAATASDCLTCAAGFNFRPGLPGGEPDCTGFCIGGGGGAPNGTFCNPNGTSAGVGAPFTLREWQAEGQEFGSTVGPMPPHVEVLARARKLLRWAEMLI